MSIICITDHDENIYNIIRKPQIHPPRSPRYRSKFKHHVKGEFTRNRDSHKTMGYAQYPVETPDNFLKKGSRYMPRPDYDPELRKCMNESKRPPIPPIGPPPKKDDTNFISKNIKNVLKFKPKPIVPKIVDTKHGDKYVLENSGMEPTYIQAKHYGKTPKYLGSRMKSKEVISEVQRDGTKCEQPACRYVTSEEREKLLEGLKLNWAKLQKEYQGLPIMTDTVPKVLRKLQMEKDLDALEKDIVTIERNPYIYVHNNGN